MGPALSSDPHDFQQNAVASTRILSWYVHLHVSSGYRIEAFHFCLSRIVSINEDLSITYKC